MENVRKTYERRKSKTKCSKTQLFARKKREKTKTKGNLPTTIVDAIYDASVYGKTTLDITRDLLVEGRWDLDKGYIREKLQELGYKVMNESHQQNILISWE